MPGGTQAIQRDPHATYHILARKEDLVSNNTPHTLAFVLHSLPPYPRRPHTAALHLPPLPSPTPPVNSPNPQHHPNPHPASPTPLPQDSASLPPLPAHARYIPHDRGCGALSLVRWHLRAGPGRDALSTHNRVVLASSAVRGPFLPPSVRVRVCTGLGVSKDV